MHTVSVVFNNQTVTVNPSEISIPNNGAFFELGIKAWDVYGLANKVFEAEEIKSDFISPKFVAYSLFGLGAFIAFAAIVNPIIFTGFFVFYISLALTIPGALLMAAGAIYFDRSYVLDDLPENKKLLNEKVLDNIIFLSKDNSALKKIISDRISKIDSLQEDIGTQFSPEMSIRRSAYNYVLVLLNNAPQMLKKGGVS